MSASPNFEADASLFTVEEQLASINLKHKVFQSIPIIEQVMDWYDHVACTFLLYDNPVLAQQKIQSIVTNFKESNDSWRSLALSQFTMDTDCDNNNSVTKLLQVLHILQQHKLLNILQVTVKTPILKIDPFRLKLFRIVDTLSEDDANQLIKCMNSKIRGPNRNNLCLEDHFLEWIKNGHISEKDCSKLDDSLAHVRNLFDKPCSTKPRPTPQNDNSTIPDELTKDGPLKFEVSHGLCIIINQENFYIDPSLPSEIFNVSKEDLKFRVGSHFDRDSLAETFRKLSCDVEIYENLNRVKLLSIMMSISQRNFTTYDALIVCILSHGMRNSIFTSDSIPISLDTIKMYFDGQHCPTLLNKPKMFFLQACQGSDIQNIVHDTHERDEVKSSLPAVSNFFEAWATVPGYASFRSPYKGSVFIGALCRVFQSYGHKESLLDLMTMVNKEVGRWVSLNHKKQMSCCTYSLLQGVQFKRRQDNKLLDSIC